MDLLKKIGSIIGKKIIRGVKEVKNISNELMNVVEKGKPKKHTRRYSSKSPVHYTKRTARRNTYRAHVNHFRKRSEVSFRR